MSDSDQRRRRHRFDWAMTTIIAGFALVVVLDGVWHLRVAAAMVLGASAVLRWVAMLVGDANPPVHRE